MKLLMIFGLIQLTYSATPFHSSALRIYNASNDPKLDIQVGQTLRLSNPIYYNRGYTQRPLMPPLESQISTNYGQQSPRKENNAGGMGLSLSGHKPISLGHLTNPKRLEESKQSQSKSSVTVLPPKNSWDTRNQLSYSKRSMRVMGQSYKDPTTSHLHPDLNSRHFRRLWKLLRDDGDRPWTSEEPPRILRQRGVSGMMSDVATPTATASVDTGLFRKVKALNITFRDQTGAQFLLPETQMQLFRNWLIEQATCEMDFIWKDLGSLYWPRWIRMGVCLSRLGSSCSWPPGMKCQPSGSRVLRLLNWNCEDALQTQTPDTEMLKRDRRAIVNLPGSAYAQSPVINLRSHLKAAKIPPSPTLPPSSASPLMKESNQVSGQRQGLDTNVFHRPARSYTPGPNWRRYYDLRRRKDRRDVALATPEEEEERKAKRAKRLMQKLSVTASGFHCSWQVQKYLISDKCTCSCA